VIRESDEGWPTTARIRSRGSCAKQSQIGTILFGRTSNT
jgi:hypothetical protein